MLEGDAGSRTGQCGMAGAGRRAGKAGSERRQP